MTARGEGVIVNVGSVLGEVPFPAMAPYVASKHGIRGFTSSLGLELKGRAPGVRVCLVEPGSIRTPTYDHALSRLGVRPKPVLPVFRADQVAMAIAGLLGNPRSAAFAPSVAGLFALSPARPGRGAVGVEPARFGRSVLRGQTARGATCSSRRGAPLPGRPATPGPGAEPLVRWRAALSEDRARGSLTAWVTIEADSSA